MKATITQVRTVMLPAPIPASMATLRRYGTASPLRVTATMASRLRMARRRYGRA